MEPEPQRSEPRENESDEGPSDTPSPVAKPPLGAVRGAADIDSGSDSSEAGGSGDSREESAVTGQSQAGAHAERYHRAGGDEEVDPQAEEPPVSPKPPSSAVIDRPPVANDRPDSRGLPLTAVEVEASRGDPLPDTQVSFEAGPSASINLPAESRREPDPTELQATASVSSLSGPTTATAESASVSPPGSNSTADDESLETASLIPVESGSTAASTSEASSGPSVKDGATDAAKLRESDSVSMGTSDDTTEREQSPSWSGAPMTNTPDVRPTATGKAAISGAIPLEQGGRGAVESSQQAAAGEHMDGEGEISQAPTLAGGDRNEGLAAGEPSTSVASAMSGAPVDSVVSRGEASTIKRLRATPFGERSEAAAAADEFGTRDQTRVQMTDELHKRATRRHARPEELDEAPPTLEPGVEEIARRLGAPLSHPSEDPSRTGTGSVDSRAARAAAEDASVTSTAQRTTETSAACPQDENISPARAASELGRASVSRRTSSRRQRRPTVSRETVGPGETADRVGEDEVMEDEAAIAVREAALRAAAQVGGISEAGQQDGAAMDSKSHVSRETLASQTNTPEDKVQAGMATDPTGTEPEAPRGVSNEQAARDARVTFRIARGGYGRFVVAVANQKGGVGKSTTAVNLGAYLALAGARVLVVDLDPQGNASTGLGLDHRGIEPSIYDVLTGEADAASAIRQTAVGNLDVLPSTIDLAGAEVELVNALSRETRLRQAIGSIRYGYDLVFIDCPPSLGLLTVNALAAADELLIPIQCEYYALEGLGQLLRNVDLVRVNLNPGLHIGGIVLTMYDGRTRLAEQVVQEVRKHFSDLVYQTVVPRSVRLSEAPGYGVPIALYDPLSRGGIAYRDLAFELADRTGLLAPTQEGAS
jgi:chromosome partitioning protein